LEEEEEAEAEDDEEEEKEEEKEAEGDELALGLALGQRAGVVLRRGRRRIVRPGRPRGSRKGGIEAVEAIAAVYDQAAWSWNGKVR
jgi:hypothetical protein